MPVITATGENINAIFNEKNLMERMVVFVDELILKQYSIPEKLINKSKHLILSISRDIPFIGYAPIRSIYNVKRENGWFTVNRMMDIDNIKISKMSREYDFIITESGLNRLEHELLINWAVNPGIKIIAANGKDKVQKILLELNKKYNNPKILVLMDLSNFGMQYQLIAKRCADNPGIFFYDYDSFEEMLFNSKFVNGQTQLNPFDYITLERFYEKALEEYTKGTKLAYHHGKKLPECYLSECNGCSNCKFNCDNKYEKIVGKDSGLLKLL